MDLSQELTAYCEQFHEQRDKFAIIESYRDGSENLIKDLLNHSHKLERALAAKEQELEDTKLDLQNEGRSRRQLQQESVVARRDFELAKLQIESLKNDNQYALCLIDGDGLIFQEHLVKQGLEGGKQAASLLRAALLRNSSLNATGEIVTLIYANLSGLAKAIVRDGGLQDTAEFKDFTLGLTQANAHFDFIDVGHGKERADSKIRENTKLHMGNPNCKDIFLGISHDSGYAPFLDNILRDDLSRQRIKVIEGVPSVREIISTSVERLDFSDLFRQDKLSARTYIELPLRPSVSREPDTPSTTTVTTRGSSPATAGSSGYSTTGAGTTEVAVPPPKITTPLSNIVGRNAVNGQATHSKTPWSPGVRGLDRVVNVSQSVLEKVRNRHPKICLHHFVRGNCRTGDNCTHLHDYDITQPELDAVTLLGRLNPCVNGQNCVDETCPYGHHCPTTSKGSCFNPKCKYAKDLHPPKTHFANPKIHLNDYGLVAQ